MKITTLQDAFAYFSNRQRCVDYVVAMRWPDGKVECPTCSSQAVTWLPTRSLFQCKGRHPKRQFSVKVGTIMEDSTISLGNWLIVMWMLGNCRNGVSSYEIQRTIGVGHKAAWFMLHRIREAMGTPQKISGIIEGDETYIGGREYNRHVSKRKGSSGRNLIGKTPVVGLVERGGSVVAQVVPSVQAKNVLPIIEANVAKDASLVITDDYPIYDSLRSKGFTHETVAHSRAKYASGPMNTNSIENFWSCLKRTIKGTYVSVSPQHLQAYVIEQVFRFNVRKGFSEQQRSLVLLNGIQGKRLTYKQLIGRA